MYIEVNFKRKDGQYGGNVYTYNCAFPVKVGDLVLAPTFKGDTPAKVVGIGIAYDEINPKYRDELRTITERYVEPEPEADVASLFEEA